MTRRGSGQRVLPQTGASRIIASGKVGTNLSRRIQSGKRFDVEAALISLFIVVSLIWSAACFLGVGLFQSFGDYLGEAFSSPGAFLENVPQLYGLVSGPVIIVAIIVLLVRGR